MVYFERTFTQPPSHCAVEPVLFLPTFPVAIILLCLVKYNSGLCIENVYINDLILPSFQHPMEASECPQAVREVHYKKAFSGFFIKILFRVILYANVNRVQCTEKVESAVIFLCVSISI